MLSGRLGPSSEYRRNAKITSRSLRRRLSKVSFGLAVVVAGVGLGAMATKRARVVVASLLASVVFLPVVLGLPLGFLNIFAALLYQREVRFGPWLTSPNDIVLFVSAGLLLPRARLKGLSRSVKIGFLAFVLGGGLAAASAASPRIAAWGAARWLAAGIIAAAAFRTLSQRRGGARVVAAAFVGLGAVASLLAVAQRLGLTFFVHGAYTPGRYNSVFGYYTDFAGFAALGIIIGFALLSDSRPGRVMSPWIVVGTVLNGVGLLLSLSRGGVLSVAAGGLFLVWMRLGDVRQTVRLVLAGLVIVGAVWFLVPKATVSTLIARVDNSSLSSGSDTERFNLQQIGKTTLVSHPFGLGYGNFRDWLVSQYGSHTGLFSIALFHCHELFLQIGLDAGWVGLAGFLLAFGSAIAFSVRYRHLAPDALPFAAALVGFGAQGLFDYVLFETGMVACVVVLLLGLEVARSNSAGKDQVDHENGALVLQGRRAE